MEIFLYAIVIKTATASKGQVYDDELVKNNCYSYCYSTVIVG